MNTANAGQQSPWVVYDYEVYMFKQMLDIVYKGEHTSFPEPIRNAILESLLLHLRILADILLSRGGFPDDIKLTNLLPGFNSPLLDKLRNEYGESKMVGSRCWTLNKMLAHPSSLRTSGYNWSQSLTAMRPIILPLLDEIEQARRVKP
jgi:hypothetical protein